MSQWQTFENPENKRQMYDSKAWVLQHHSHLTDNATHLFLRCRFCLHIQSGERKRRRSSGTCKMTWMLGMEQSVLQHSKIGLDMTRKAKQLENSFTRSACLHCRACSTSYMLHHTALHWPDHCKPSSSPLQSEEILERPECQRTCCG